MVVVSVCVGVCWVRLPLLLLLLVAFSSTNFNFHQKTIIHALETHELQQIQLDADDELMDEKSSFSPLSAQGVDEPPVEQLATEEEDLRDVFLREFLLTDEEHPSSLSLLESSSSLLSLVFAGHPPSLFVGAPRVSASLAAAKLQTNKTNEKFKQWIKQRPSKRHRASELHASFSSNRATIVKLNARLASKRHPVRFRSSGPFAAMTSKRFREKILNTKNFAAKHLEKALKKKSTYDTDYTPAGVSRPSPPSPPSFQGLVSNAPSRASSSARRAQKRALVQIHVNSKNESSAADPNSLSVGGGRSAGLAGSKGGSAGGQGGLAGSKGGSAGGQGGLAGSKGGSAGGQGGLAGSKGGSSGAVGGLAGSKGGQGGGQGGIAGSKGGDGPDAFGTIKSAVADPRFACAKAKAIRSDSRQSTFNNQKWLQLHDQAFELVETLVGKQSDASKVPTAAAVEKSLIKLTGNNQKDGTNIIVIFAVDYFNQLLKSCGVGYLLNQSTLSLTAGGPLTLASLTQHLTGTIGISKSTVNYMLSDLRTKKELKAAWKIGQAQVNDVCGSCWAHASSFVAQHFRDAQIAQWSWDVKTNRPFVNASIPPANKQSGLSPQQLLNCVQGKDTKGCSGGTPMDALSWWKSNPAGLLSEFPLTDTPGPCLPVRSTQWGSGWIASWGWDMIAPPCAEKVGPCIQQARAEIAMLKQLRDDLPPMIAYVDASHWQHYSGGLFPVELCSNTMEAGNHVVLVRGYGTYADTGIPYWIVQNSWGSSWGERGLVHLPFGLNACGIGNFVITGTPYPGYRTMRSLRLQ